MCPGRLLIEGLINHLLLYRNEIGISDILFVLQSVVKGSCFVFFFSFFYNLWNEIFQSEMQKITL